VTDNEWNWRFREELAQQLLAAVSLFTAEDIRKHLTPIAISLLLDKVAAVRQVALCLVSMIPPPTEMTVGMLSVKGITKAHFQVFDEYILKHL
jgi:hypothetical protein